MNKRDLRMKRKLQRQVIAYSFARKAISHWRIIAIVAVALTLLPAGCSYGDEVNYDPAWSPDGSKIAFTSGGTGGGERIWVINADGSNRTDLTGTSFGACHDAMWSPDGSKIAFAKSHIWVMNADGSNPTRLTDNAKDDFFPVWSPDGSKIAFTSRIEGKGNAYIRVMNADGSNQTRLTDNASDDYSPAWSPDGSKIAFHSVPPGTDSSDIWVMNADGSNQTRLTGTR